MHTSFYFDSICPCKMCSHSSHPLFSSTATRSVPRVELSRFPNTYLQISLFFHCSTPSHSSVCPPQYYYSSPPSLPPSSPGTPLPRLAFSFTPPCSSPSPSTPPATVTSLPNSTKKKAGTAPGQSTTPSQMTPRRKGRPLPRPGRRGRQRGTSPRQNRS